MKFRYESLLKYKAFIEETKMGELAEATAKLVMEEKKLFYMEEIRRQAFEELADKQTKDAVPHEILMYQTYLYHINIEIEKQQKMVMETQSLYDEKRELLIVATQDKKIIEQVKSQDRLIMMESAKRVEKKAMDEVGNSRYVRVNC